MEATLNRVMQRLKQMSPEELRAEIDKHKDGNFAVALRELQEFSEFLFNNTEYE